ncbi:MAG: hypothetical protein SPI12_05840 [Actinomycetaceae bacterium]|nr:hypothetical protein [Actinomycetaceae bacterium]MDY6083359.1 hypothetical protein [Actinomycetaceae bacterium]
MVSGCGFPFCPLPSDRVFAGVGHDQAPGLEVGAVCHDHGVDLACDLGLGNFNGSAPVHVSALGAGQVVAGERASAQQPGVELTHLRFS